MGDSLAACGQGLARSVVVNPALGLVDEWGVDNLTHTSGFVSLGIVGGFGLPRDIDRSFDRPVTSPDCIFRTWPTRRRT